MSRITFSFAAVVAVAFAVLSVMAWQINATRELGRQNRAHTAEIQQNRVVSCEQTYQGVREVFRPFWPARQHRKGVQQRNYLKFQSTIDRLKNECPRQTSGLKR